MSLQQEQSAPPRVCIVTPGQIGSNPRVVKEADALHEAGFRVTVIATRTLDCVEPRDRSLMRRIRWRLERLDLRSKWRWRLRRAGQISFRHVYSRTGFASFADFGFSAYTYPLFSAALRTPAELYIAHYPAALPAAATVARRHGGRFAYDAEDFHLGDWPDSPEYEVERRLIRAIERRYLSDCAHVTAASPGIADAYLEAYGIKRPRVILNVFPVIQAPPGPMEKGSAEPGPSVYWLSQTIGPNRGLECAVRAIGRAVTRPHLYLRGTPAAGFVDSLHEIAAGCGAGAQLHILPPDEPDKMARLASIYDIGLVAENGQTRNRDIALTNKLFTFLLAGIPVVMSNTTAHSTFASETGMSDHIYATDDPRALAAVIDRLLGDQAALATARAEAYRLGRERYNWDIESRQLVKLTRSDLDTQESIDVAGGTV